MTLFDDKKMIEDIKETIKERLGVQIEKINSDYKGVDLNEEEKQRVVDYVIEVLENTVDDIEISIDEAISSVEYEVTNIFDTAFDRIVDGSSEDEDIPWTTEETTKTENTSCSCESKVKNEEKNDFEPNWGEFSYK